VTPTRAWLLVLVATATMSVSYLDRQVLAALAPTLTSELGLDETAFGLLGSSFAVAYLLGAVPSGVVLDRFGPRRVLPAAVATWSLVAAAHALAAGPWSLGALRVALGLAESPSFPAAAQTVARALPPGRREAATGILFTGSSVGAAVAAALVPALAAQVGWRGAFAVSALVGLAWVPAWLLVTRGLPQLGPAPSAAKAPLATLLREPSTWRAVVAVVGSAPINGFVLQWAAKLLVGRHGVDPAAVGRYLWAPPLAFDLGAVGFGVLAAAAARRGGAGALQRPLFAVAGALLLSIGALRWAATPWQTTAVAALAIAGGGGVYTLCNADLLTRVPTDRAAAASSLTAAAQSLALIVTLPLIGRVLDRSHDWGQVGFLLATLAAPTVVGWLLWSPPRPAAG
jgi:MFS family permease